MIRNFFKLLSGNILGKIVGFLREIIIAALYGVSAPVGALRVAQTATLIPVNFFTSDSLNAGFIPLYIRYKAENFHKAQSLFWVLKFIFIVISLFLSFMLFYFARVWVHAIAPGFENSELELGVMFVKVMAIGIPFYIISTLYSYLAIANQSYFLASIRPTIQSFGMIVGVSVAFYTKNIVFFAWGFTLSYIIFFLLGIYNLQKKSLLSFSFEHTKEILMEFWKIIRPLLLLPLMLQTNIAIEKIVASYMGVGVVASVEYAKFITETGIVLLAMPLGLVGLSTLSSLTEKEVKNKLEQIIPLVLLVTIPASLFLIVYSDTIITLLFKRGAFSQDAVFLTQSVLLGLSIGFWAQVASYVMIKALNAQHRNKEVVIYMAIALVANALFNIIFYKVFGPVTIGIGASIYGIVLFVFTSNAFKISKKIFITMIWLISGSIVYYIIQKTVSFDTNWISLLISIFIFILYWMLLILSIPNLRSEIMPLIGRLKGKR